MPFVGITPPFNGMPPERRVEREKRVRRVDRGSAVQRESDEAELTSVEQTTPAEAVQDDASEEGREDRAAHGSTPVYKPGPRREPPEEPPRKIDLKG